MPDIIFTVDDKDYIAHLRSGYITSHGKDKKLCTCIITSDNPIRDYAGSAIKNPNDGMKYDENYGFHLAFKRALFYQYVIERSNNVLHGDCFNISMKKLLIDWDDYLKKFRIPFGKALHEWYKNDMEFPF